MNKNEPGNTAFRIFGQQVCYHEYNILPPWR